MSQSLFQHTKHEEYCPQCGAPLQMKQGKKGLFLGCTAYPACDYLRPLHKVEYKVLKELDEEQSIDCPECHKGYLVARRGRQGKIFYGCNNFPHCKFSLPAKPCAIPCPQCHFPLALLKSENAEQQVWQCANKSCRHIFENEK